MSAGSVDAVAQRRNTRLYPRRTCTGWKSSHAHRELGVNLAGVEVILNMREKMEKDAGQVEEMIAFVREQINSSAADSFRSALVRVPATKIVRSQR